MISNHPSEVRPGVGQPRSDRLGEYDTQRDIRVPAILAEDDVLVAAVERMATKAWGVAGGSCSDRAAELLHGSRRPASPRARPAAPLAAWVRLLETRAGSTSSDTDDQADMIRPWGATSAGRSGLGGRQGGCW